MEQEAIDKAFQKQQRRSGVEVEWQGNSFLLLTALNTGRLRLQRKDSFFLTGVERTLLDMTVRPLYGGRAAIILKANIKALPILSVENLIQLLDTIGFSYPYQQALGFYLSRAGFKGIELEDLKKRPTPYRFYLDYEMKAPLYCKEWNIFYPSELG